MEAVVNSIQAMRENQQGCIRVRIEREPVQTQMHGNAQAPIAGFEIEDEGEGFGESNFGSFETLDSRTKIEWGGKGVGRLTWLKAFEYAEITSVFVERGELQKRSFSFRLTTDGVIGHRLEPAPKGASPRTVVRLIGFRSSYQSAVPKTCEAIAKRIMEHCLPLFILGVVPAIVVEDSSDKESQFNLQEIFAETCQTSKRPRKFSVAATEFKISDVLLAQHGAKHTLHFCANGRVVLSEPLNRHVNHLSSKIETPDGPRVYQAYVTSDLLDERADAQRTFFSFDREGEMAYHLGPTWESVHAAVLEAISNFVEPYVLSAREAHMARVKGYIASNPQFRHLLKYRQSVIENLPSDLSDDELGLRLLRIKHELREQTRNEASRRIRAAETVEGFEAFREQFSKAFEVITDVARSDLADYVADRATVLKYLEMLLGKAVSGKFHKEDDLHRVFFPMRTSSDDIEFSQHNLWLLDERLSYHAYLSSDVRFSSQRGPVQVNDASRPDLLIYNNPHSFTSDTSEIGSVIIVEFKRPERNDYKANAFGDENEINNPIDQVMKYVRRIRAGTARRADGSTIEGVSPDTPFYCYIVATLTDKLLEEANGRGFFRMPDGLGYFFYNSPMRTYIELLSYRKVLNDASKRNQAFFDKLQIVLR
jgi:hypothetical protein